MRAILAVYDKSGVEAFARQLSEMGWELIATGGTARAIEAAGLPVTPVEDVTGSPEMLGGRVKTLHPAVHGGILYRRGLDADEEEVAKHGIVGIDLVACNLYPFVETVTTGDPSLADALEQIDIGGPTMIRAAAKNHPSVLPVVNPDDYEAVIEALRAGGGAPGSVPQDLRKQLAARAFAHVAHYDTLIAEYLRDDDDPAPEQLTVALTLTSSLRYGENPHQAGSIYRTDSVRVPAEGIGGAVQHHGRAMSYVNYLDADAAFNLVSEFAEPAVAIIKHTNPACFATGPEQVTPLYERALTEGDYVSAYGGIVATNQTVDMDFATSLRDFRSPGGGMRMFYEIVIAPAYEPEALEHLKKKSKDLRILEAPIGDVRRPRPDYRSLRGAMLAQGADLASEPAFDVVSERAPTESELADLRIAWVVCKHVKSNAVAFVKDSVLIGMGAGQPNRVQSARLCRDQAGERARGAVAASDALIPFPDTVEVCADAGCTVVAHTGGSIRDEESVSVANERGISLVTTGMRHFRH